MDPFDTYIFYTECPLDGSIKFISSGKYPKIPYDIGKFHAFNEWKTELKEKGKKMIINIIDRVPMAEIDFWMAYYRDLFRTFGFNLWGQLLRSPTDQKAFYHIGNLSEYLKRNDDLFSRRYHVQNISIILYLLNDLFSISFRSKYVDMNTLIYVLVFLFGVPVERIKAFCFNDLREIISEKNRFTRNLNYPKPKRFIEIFIRVYAKPKSEDLANNLVLGDMEIDEKIMDKRFEIYAKYFGYQSGILCKECVKIFSLIYLRTHGTSRDNTDFIQRCLDVDFKYVKRYLINSRSTMFFPPTDSDVLNSILWK